MKQTDVEQRVREVNWPAPPPALRTRVLSMAPIVEQPITWSDRVWFSRGWRLAAVAVALVVLAVEILPMSRQSADVGPTQQALADVRAIDETGRQAGLPPDVAASLASRALSGARQSSAPEQDWAALLEFAPDGGRR